MSVRRTSASKNQPHVEQLQKELGELKNAALLAANVADTATPASAEAAPNAPGFNTLSGTEQAAASLGVHPESWKPIGFLNNGHFSALMKQNALDDDLARRIEAYRTVAGK